MLQIHSFKDSTQFVRSFFYIFSFKCHLTAPLLAFDHTLGSLTHQIIMNGFYFSIFDLKETRNLVASLVSFFSVFSDGGCAKSPKIAEQLLNAPTRKSSDQVD